MSNLSFLTARPHCSIVIPVFNQLHFTKQCVESLLADTDRPHYELVIVDNGSTDETRSYLESLCASLDKTDDYLVSILNNENRGVAPAWNQGVQASRGKYIAVINNDILVSNGWFKSLLWSLEYHNLALISPFAAVGELNYDFKTRAQRFTRKNLTKLWNDYDFCCFLMHKRTYDKIGPFDENFKVGGYEDTDYAYRLTQKNLKYAVSGASFIHHFGSRTLGGFKLTGDKHAPGNKAYFISKWKEDPSKAANTWRGKIKRTWRRLKIYFDWM